MVTLHFILLLLALLCFVAAAAGMASRVNLVALGLALATLELLVR